MAQWIIVIAVVCLAVAYALRGFYRTIKDGPQCNCGSCNGCKAQECNKKQTI